MAKQNTHGGKRKGAGRKPDPDARKHRITTVWNDADFAKIKRLAKREGVSWAAIVFGVALPALRRRR